jgi:hypothetical protein
LFQRKCVCCTWVRAVNTKYINVWGDRYVYSVKKSRRRKMYVQWKTGRTPWYNNLQFYRPCKDFYQGTQTLVSRWHKAIEDRKYVEKQCL